MRLWVPCWRQGSLAVSSFSRRALNPADDPTRALDVRPPSRPQPNWWDELVSGSCSGFDRWLQSVKKNHSSKFSQDQLLELGGSFSLVLAANRRRPRASAPPVPQNVLAAKPPISGPPRAVAPKLQLVFSASKVCLKRASPGPALSSPSPLRSSCAPPALLTSLPPELLT